MGLPIEFPFSNEISICNSVLLLIILFFKKLIILKYNFSSPLDSKRVVNEERVKCEVERCPAMSDIGSDNEKMKLRIVKKKRGKLDN